MKPPTSLPRGVRRSSVQFREKSRELPHKSGSGSRRKAAKSRKVRRAPTTLLTASKTKGRKPRINAAQVLLASNRLHASFESHAERIDWGKFVAAKSEEDLKAALDVASWNQLTSDLRTKGRQEQIRILRDLTAKLAASAELETILRPRFGLILEILNDPKFPHTNRNAQLRFLSDSLAGDGIIRPRRSRDICAQQRKRHNPEHEIIRREFYIECTCGYKGPALNGGCKECATQKLAAKAGSLQGVHSIK